MNLKKINPRKILQNRKIQNMKSNIGGSNHQRQFQQLVWNIAQIQGNSV